MPRQSRFYGFTARNPLLRLKQFQPYSLLVCILFAPMPTSITATSTILQLNWPLGFNGLTPLYYSNVHEAFGLQNPAVQLQYSSTSPLIKLYVS